MCGMSSKKLATNVGSADMVSISFHAWQSSLLFTCLFGLHIIFSFTAVISYILLVVDLVLVAFLTLHAYKDGMYLDKGGV